MTFLDFIKGKILDVPDFINRKLHPFDEFTREAVIRDSKSLAAKSDIFWDDIRTNWTYGDGCFYWSMRGNDGGDMAIWQGWALMAAILRGDRPMIGKFLKGCELLQTLGGDNRIARGADACRKTPGTIPHYLTPHKIRETLARTGYLEDENNDWAQLSKYIPKDMTWDPSRRFHYADSGDTRFVYHQNCSESSLIGILFGYWSVMRWPNDNALKKVEALIDGLAQQLIADEYRMLDKDGTPAKYGDLRPEFSTAPIRVGALACLLLLAYNATGKKDYMHRYLEIVKKMKGALTHQETHVLWVHPQYQDVLAYMTYSMLATMDDISGERGTWRRALQKLWERTNHEGNSFYTYLTLSVLGNITQEYLDQAEKTLHEFNTDMEKPPKAPGTVRPDRSGLASIGCKTKHWGWSWLKGGKLISLQPIPMHMRAGVDIAWQRSPYFVGGHGDHHHNSLDFVIARELGKMEGALKD